MHRAHSLAALRAPPQNAPTAMVASPCPQVRNLASLFGIPTWRMRVPTVVAGSLAVDVEIAGIDPCDDVASCGPNGFCTDGKCICLPGWYTPAGCAYGDCECTRQLSCANGCRTCESMSNCTSCARSSTTPFLFEGACVDSCPLGTYPDPASLSCLPCDASCPSCRGGGPNRCTSCESLGTNAYMLDGQCVLECPLDGYYPDGSHRVCQPCDSSCKQCAGPSSADCTACVPNPCANSICPSATRPILDTLDIWTLHQKHSNHTGQCVSKCPGGRYHANNGMCKPCDLACKTCTGGGSQHCTACIESAQLSGGRCHLQCGSGQAAVTGWGVAPTRCTTCDNYDCSVCDPANTTRCLKCKHPDDVSSWASDWIRSVMEVPYVCHERCTAPGTYVTTNRSCAGCHEHCETCNGADSQSCLTCPAGRLFHRGQCLTKCPDGFGANATAHCEPCRPSCATCIGTAPVDNGGGPATEAGNSYPCTEGLECTHTTGFPTVGSEASMQAACDADDACVQYQYNSGQSYGFKCNALGTELDEDVSVCKKVVPQTPGECTSCHPMPTSQPFLISGNCTTICPLGLYGLESTGLEGETTLAACVPCDKGCVECSGPAQCLECEQPTPPPDEDPTYIELRNAGASAVNGRYVRSGLANGAPKYRHESGALWIRQGRRNRHWVITPRDSDRSALKLYAVRLTSGIFERRPPLTGWSVDERWSRERAEADGWAERFDEISERRPPPRDVLATTMLLDGVCTTLGPEMIVPQASRRRLQTSLPIDESAAAGMTQVLAAEMRLASETGRLDTGLPVTRVRMWSPPVRTARPPVNSSIEYVYEKQRIVLWVHATESNPDVESPS